MNQTYQRDIRVLVIEDNRGDFVLIDEYLAEQNVSGVDHAISFDEAVAKLHLNKGEYSAILLDLTLPGKSGEELITDIVNLAGNASVIVLTGYSDMKFSIRSLSLGVSDYLLKDELTPLGLWKSILYGIERKLASRNLEDSEKKYRYLFEKNPSPMLIWEVESREIVDSNLEAGMKYGYSKEQFRQLRIDDLRVDETITQGKPEAQTDLSEVTSLLAPKVWQHRKKNGELFFAEINGHELIYRGSRASLFLINDVTEKIELQERMLESALRAEESERNRIALELHDGIVQQLAACGMFAQNLFNLAGDDQPLKNEISRLHDLIRKTTIHTRDISHKLKSAEFEEMNLQELLKQLAVQLSHLSNIRFSFNNYLKEDADGIDISLKINIYRSVQELCNNIIKHSGADSAIITAEKVDDILYLSIKDNGVGLRTDREIGNGVGLANVKNGIQRFGGQIALVQPGDETGVRVDLEIPVASAKK